MPTSGVPTHSLSDVPAIADLTSSFHTQTLASTCDLLLHEWRLLHQVCLAHSTSDLPALADLNSSFHTQTSWRGRGVQRRWPQDRERARARREWERVGGSSNAPRRSVCARVRVASRGTREREEEEGRGGGGGGGQTRRDRSPYTVLYRVTSVTDLSKGADPHKPPQSADPHRPSQSDRPIRVRPINPSGERAKAAANDRKQRDGHTDRQDERTNEV